MIEQKCTSGIVLTLSFVCIGPDISFFTGTLHWEKTHVSHLGNKNLNMGSRTPRISSYRREKNAQFLFSSRKLSKD